MIELIHVSRSFPITGTVLKDVNLTVNDGEFLSLWGPSGSGKSSLLSIIGLLDGGFTGEYRLDGQKVNPKDENKLADLRLRSLGFVFQTFNLVPYSDLLDNVALPLGYLGVSAARRRARAAELLAAVGITEGHRRLPGVLSGGEQQRVAIARALAADPQVILADEPTGNLDAANGQKIMEILSALNARGKTVILVTHDPTVRGYARRVIRIDDGTLSE